MGRKKYKQLWDREWLYQMRCIKKLTMDAIANLVGCSGGTVQNALKKQNIHLEVDKAKIAREAGLRRAIISDREWLYEKYWIDGLNMKEIAELLGCSPTAVDSAMKRFNIPKRKRSMKGESNPFYNKKHTKKTKQEISKKRREKYENYLWNKDWLYEKYWVEDLTINEIATIIGCRYPTVWRALKRYGITTKPRKPPSPETRIKLSIAGKGRKPWNKGKSTPDDVRKKISESLRGEKNPWYGKHHTEEAKEKMRKAYRHRIFPRSGTKPELIFLDLCRKFGILDRIEDTRNNSFHIGRLNPDFIIRDMRVAIFINGDYWHSPLLRPKIRETATANFQIKECRKRKWKALIIWEADLKRKDAEAFVLSVLKREGVI